LPPHAPFDRVVAWCSVSDVPQSWRAQTRPGAVLVVPIRVDEKRWVAKYRRTRQGTLVEDGRVSGGFIPATATPIRPWESAK